MLCTFGDGGAVVVVVDGPLATVDGAPGAVEGVVVAWGRTLEKSVSGRGSERRPVKSRPMTSATV